MDPGFSLTRSRVSLSHVHMETLMYFYFEAQTGRIHLKAPQAPSNFFRYTFDLKPPRQGQALGGAGRSGL